MRTLRVALAIAVALFAQTMLSPLLGRTSVVVDLGLVVVVFTGLVMGPVAGLLAGTVTGLMQDALAGGIVGLSGLSKTLVGFGSGVFGTMFIVARPGPRYVVFFLASIVDSAILAGLHAILDIRSFPPAFATIVVRALLSAAVGVMVFLAIESLPKFAERRKLGKGRTGTGRI
jgi:rod shape-determining protein MreD